MLESYGVPVPKLLGYSVSQEAIPNSTGDMSSCVRMMLIVEYLGDLTVERAYPSLTEEERKVVREGLLETIGRVQSIKEESIQNLDAKRSMGYFRKFVGRPTVVEDAIDFSMRLEPVTIHGDFNSTNILMKGNKLYLVDFNDMSRGPGLLDPISIFHDRALNLSVPEAREIVRGSFNPTNDELESQELISFACKIGVMKELSTRSKGRNYFLNLLRYYVDRLVEYCDIVKRADLAIEVRKIER